MRGYASTVPRRPPLVRRWTTAATWPIGIALTSWDYMWRSTPMHRREVVEPDADPHLPPRLPAGVEDGEVIGPEHGYGPHFHRRYATTIRDTALSPPELIDALAGDINQAAPTAFARFQKVLGASEKLAVGDEYVVRMPGPWDGPVRVIERRPDGFRLATLDGHLEAGQIEFRASRAAPGRLRFEIESWARSSSRLTNLLYHRLRMAKEVQLHMWISFLEGVVDLADGRMTGGVEVLTHRVEPRAER